MGFIPSSKLSDDGSPDATFSTAGLVTTTLANPVRIHDMALQPNGKILLAGQYGGGSSTDFWHRWLGDHGSRRWLRKAWL